ncbi:MAG: hypothetical protein LUH20_10430 [Lachnospiraceae bacterium]|nr:hypothetical protein [Lachnospiraceae bacterium]
MSGSITYVQFWGISVLISLLLVGMVAILYKRIRRWYLDKRFEDEIDEMKNCIAERESPGVEVAEYKYKNREKWEKACARFREEEIGIWQMQVIEYPDRPGDNVYKVLVYAGRKAGNRPDEPLGKWKD